MKKNIFITMLLFLSVWAGGCIDDQGNYDYLEPEKVIPVKISGLEDNYYFTLWQDTTLIPEVSGVENEEEYQFIWYTMKSGRGSIKTADTISRTKQLNWQVTCESGFYDLVFEVKNKRTGVFVNKEMKLQVNSLLSRGWYVMKDENEQTDIDLVFPDGEVEKDMLENRIGVKLEGTAVGMCYVPSNYYHEEVLTDGSVNKLRTKALIVLASRDLKILNADNLTVYKNWEEAFYTAPDVCKPQWCNNGIFLLNNGKLHSIYTASENAGKFGMAWSGDYDFFPGALVGNQFFDRNSKSFYAAGSSFNTLPVGVAEPTATSPVQVSANHMKADMVAAITSYSSLQKSYALLKSTESDQYYLAGISKTGNGTYPFTSYDEVPGGSRLLQSTVFGTHQTVSCVYFGLNNELWGYTVADVAEREAKLYTFPQDETIAYIEHVVSNYAENKVSCLVVLTNSSAGWKMYRFEFDGSTAEILDQPVGEPASGKGTARYVMFRNY